ncbi:hypothetical protein QBC38DRAFT_440742 [Podospora fimiseda]|uniref:Uncharacterized protein n=1 Tax=Podospora fimiseda TaxID=252190 RepID=A0AAN7H0C4_9PEZI|nr:hypothetical protein QBC38DRAFT_440742 [Podospora fimiseda]
MAIQRSSSGPAWMAKFGRYDYERFDNITSTPLLVTKKTIGSVEVECMFAFSKSLWGVIGENENPAGIVYLDLNFRQPPDCKLQSATVTVELEKDSKDFSGPGHGIVAAPVQFTDHYGPKHLSGQKTFVDTRRTKKMTPEIQLLGQVGVGGVGLNKETFVQTFSRWEFKGHISSTAGNTTYNRLRWSLVENPYEIQPTHCDKFHTAFALEHNAKRLYMTVKVKGKLLRLSSRAASVFKFGGKGHDAVTKVEWSGDYRHSVRLDEIAEGLPMAMEHENTKDIPVEVSDAWPASYHTAPTEPENTRSPAQESLMQPASLSTLDYSRVVSEPYSWRRTAGQRQRPHKSEHKEPLENFESVIGHLPSSTPETLGRASGLIVPPSIEIPRAQPTDRASDLDTSTTLVDADAHSPLAITQDLVASSKASSIEKQSAGKEEEIMGDFKQLWQLAGKMTILILAMITGAFGLPLERRFLGRLIGLLEKLKFEGEARTLPEMEGLSVARTLPSVGWRDEASDQRYKAEGNGKSMPQRADIRLRWATTVN